MTSKRIGTSLTSLSSRLMPAVLTLLLAAPAINTKAQTNDPARLEIPEFGAVITSGNDGPRVTDVTPVAGRLEKYQTVNLQSGDLVVAANGQRIKTLGDLRELLSGLTAGDPVRLGVQRFGRLVVAAFEVATEAEIVAAQEKARAAAAEAAKKPAGCQPQIVQANVDGSIAGGCGKVVMHGGDGKAPWIDMSVMLEDADGKVRVGEPIELPFRLVDNVPLATGDLLTSLQGTPVKSTGELTALYDGLEVGDHVTLVYSRNGQQAEFTFTKPEPPAGVRKVIRKQATP